MNITSKKSIIVVMSLPFALALGMMTVVAAGKLGEFFEYGQFSVPDTADYDSVLRALLYGVFSFLGLLSIPRVVLYLKGTTKRRWTFLLYWGVPFALTFVLSDLLIYIAWTAIACFAWLEVLVVLDPFGKIFPPPPTKR